MPAGLRPGPDGLLRCPWCTGDPTYLRYHDEEWGFPVADDRRLFEKICLEGFQAGLSWLTILRKREAFRCAFAGFEIGRLARFDGRQVARLLRDPGIVRHRGKIESALHNARRAQELVGEFGSLAAYLWRFEPPAARSSRGPTLAQLRRRTESAESRALARDLRRRGFRYVGPTTLYALFQAMGLVNDHLEGCAVRPRAEAARRRFVRPWRSQPARPSCRR